MWIEPSRSTYVSNLLQIQFIHLFTPKVEIQTELEELEESESVEDNEVFDLELDPFDAVVGEDPVLDSGSESSEGEDDDSFSDLSSDAGDLDDDEPFEIQTDLSHIQDMVKKLDATLMLLFKHFEQTVDTIGKRRLTDPEGVLPALPPLDLASPGGLSSPLSQILGPSYTQTAGFDPITTPTPLVPPSPTPLSALPPNKEKLKATLRNQFNTLLSIFDRTILRTFKSRYTQFLIFWYTSVDPEFADVFQGMLVERALMPGASSAVLVRSSLEDDSRLDETSTTANIHLLTPEVTRAAAASYIGSFVSRATFVDREGTRRVIGVLCEFVKAHLEGVEQAVRDGVFGFDSSASSMLASGQHLVFYSVIQAIFLIFCFRWRDLMIDGVDDEEDLSLKGTGGHPRRTTTSPGRDIWLPGLSILKRAVSSILNPLKVCSSNVVNQFARIAHSTNFLYCYTILDVNRRAEVGDSSPPSFGAERNTTIPRHPNNVAELNTFFPFDPCRLPKSNSFIQGIYREWESVKIQGDDEEDEEDEEKEDTDKAVDSVKIGAHLAIPRKTPNVDEGGLGESLGAMSISPATVLKGVSV